MQDALVHLWMTDTSPKGKGYPGDKNGRLDKNIPGVHHGVQETGMWSEERGATPKLREGLAHSREGWRISGARSGYVLGFGYVLLMQCQKKRGSSAEPPGALVLAGDAQQPRFGSTEEVLHPSKVLLQPSLNQTLSARLSPSVRDTAPSSRAQLSSQQPGCAPARNSAGS